MTTRRSFLAASTAAAAGAFISKGASAADVATTQLPAKWDAETDVLVAGSGIAGMSAAISALDKGAKVLVMEKGKNYGGCAIINGGIIALGGGTRTQKEHGVKFLPTFTQPGKYDSQHHESYHHIWWKDSGEGGRKPQPTGGFMTGRGIMMPYYEYFTGKGGQIFLEHKVLDVYVNDQGAVIGAKVQKPDGSIMNVKANKGVVLAGGSWKANPELRRLTDPRFTENMISTGYPFVAPDGSAILAGMRAGGMYVGDRCEDTTHLRRKFGTAHYGFPKGSKYGAPGLGISGPRWAEVIFTNKSGDRFVKELDKANLGGYTFYDAALAQPEQFLWTVFDDATAKKYHWDTKAPTCEEGYAFTAPTIAELAKLTNQPNLEQTVARYNGFVDAKKDDDFDKPAESLTKKIEQGPFHAVRLVLCVHNLTGGLAINDNAQVLGQDMKPIKGLYAAGETAGGLYVGNGMPRAIMPGRWAGEHAAAN